MGTPNAESTSGDVDTSTEHTPTDLRRRAERIVRYHLLESLNGGYRRLVGRVALDVEKFGYASWGQLPIVDKAFLTAQEYASRPAVDAPVLILETSGTTSSVVAVPHTAESVRRTLGENFLRALRLGGLRSGNRVWGIEHRLDSSHLTGSQLSFRWLHDQMPDKVVVTETSQPIADHLDVLRAWRPDCIASAPGFLVRLASTLDEAAPPTAVVLYGGAALAPAAKRIVVAALRPGRLVGFYPTTDTGALGVSPTDNGVYRCFSETHLVEVVDADGRHVAEGQEGDLLVTALDNPAAPLIRYRIGDRVRYLGRRRGRVLVSDIRRYADATLGATNIPIADLATWTERLQSVDPSVVAVQLVRASDTAGRDRPVLRVTTPSRSLDLPAAALRLLADYPQVMHEVATGDLAEPTVEVVTPEQSLRGRWKLPVFVDETRRR
jgi:hypothetical protein